MKSGDILLFEGKGFISWLIKTATRSKFSHVGLVYRDRSGKLYCFHSTSLSKPVGTKLVPLKELMDSYKGNIYSRALAKPLSALHRTVFKVDIQNMCGIDYESSKLELFLAAFGRKLNIKVSHPSAALYCSEVVSVIYRHLNFLHHSKALTPRDFSEDGRAYLHMQNNTLLNTIQRK